MMPEAERTSEAETPEAQALRLQVRSLWDAAVLLKAADTGLADSTAARGLLHREALRLGQRTPTNTAAEDEAQHAALLRTLEADIEAAHQRQLRRFGALGAGVLGLCVAVFLGQAVLRRASAPVDLAAGKPFTLSSTWNVCHPEQGECGGYPTRIAFHTHEQQSPWYQVDLGAPTTFSSLSIRNRTDTALWRAVPLVLEVSDDGATFVEVARRTDVFVDWDPHFPARQARYVRLRVDRVSTLHLESVGVHP
jgi:F5/8 type C domain